MVSCLVNVCQQVLILQENSPVFFIVINIFVEFWRKFRALLLKVFFTNFGWRDSSWAEASLFSIDIEISALYRSSIAVLIFAWCSSESVWRWRLDRVIFHHSSSRQVNFFCREKNICVCIVIVWLRIWIGFTFIFGIFVYFGEYAHWLLRILFRGLEIFFCADFF